MDCTCRDLLANLSVGIAIASAGCVSLEGQNGGRLRMFRTDTPPSEAETVERSNSSIESSHIIQTNLDNVVESSYVETSLSKSDFRSVSSALEDLPYYDRSDYPDSSYPSGYYVRLDDYYACIKLNAYCSDIPGVSVTREEHGDCVTR